jgi:hypothetical protein
MRKLGVFNNVSLDGYFVEANGDMHWAYKAEPMRSGMHSSPPTPAAKARTTNRWPEGLESVHEPTSARKLQHTMRFLTPTNRKPRVNA